MKTYRSEKFRSRDGGAVTVQLDSTSQVKVTDLDWGYLTDKQTNREKKKKGHFIREFQLGKRKEAKLRRPKLS